MRQGKRWWSRLGRAGLSFLLVMACSGGAGALAEAVRPEVGVEEREKLAKLLDRLGTAARQENGRSAAESWDYRSQAALLAHDPQGIFAFVRDQILFEPYDGQLRGSEGVMIARAGNAMEQAGLLRDMLQSAGFEARLVSARLPDARAQALIEEFSTRDPLERSVLAAHAHADVTDLEREMLDSLLRELGIPGGLWATWGDQAEAERTLVQQQLQADWQREEQFIRSRLDEAGIVLGVDATPARASLEAATAAGHVWVQYHDRDLDQWIDLDPTFGEAQPGQVLAEADAEAFVPEPEMIHRLTFRLILRQSTGDDSRDIALLDVPLEIHQLARQPVRFSIYPDPARLPSATALGETPPEQLRKQILEINTYQAALTIGRQSHTSLMFDRESGETSEPSRFAAAERVGREMQRIGGGLGGALAGNGEGPRTSLERLWVELIFDGPGGSRVQERVLLDDQPMRRPTLMTEWDLFVQAQPLSRPYVQYAKNRFVAAVSPVLAQMLRTQRPPSPGEIMELQQSLLNPGLIFAVQRQEALARMLQAMDADDRPAVLWPKANLFITRQNLRVAEEESWLCSGFDIVQNQVLFLDRRTGLTPAAAIAMRLGVLDTCLEELVVAGCPKSSAPEGTVSYFTQRRMQGDDAVSVIRARPEDLAQAGMPEYSRQWIAQAKPTNSLAIIPDGWNPDEGAFYYWSVDPATGQCVGRSWDGSGQAKVEYTHVLTIISWGQCVIGSATGAGYVQTTCCFVQAALGFKYIDAAYVKLNALIFIMTTIPYTDPCTGLGNFVGGY